MMKKEKEMLVAMMIWKKENYENYDNDEKMNYFVILDVDLSSSFSISQSY
jgi:hypothetical protein